MALRAALGAGRARIMRQTLTECTVLAAFGGILGVPAAILLNYWMATWVPLNRPICSPTETDLGAATTSRVSSLSGGHRLRVSAGPAQCLRRGMETLGAGARTVRGPEEGRIGALLVVGELALLTALGIGTLLMAKSFIAERLADHGYRVEDVVSLRLDLDPTEYEDPAQRVAFVERALERIETLPNVESAGATNRLPAGQGFTEARLEVLKAWRSRPVKSPSSRRSG